MAYQLAFHDSVRRCMSESESDWPSHRPQHPRQCRGRSPHNPRFQTVILPAMRSIHPHTWRLCGWIERIPGGTRQNDGLETGLGGTYGRALAWPPKPCTIRVIRSSGVSSSSSCGARATSAPAAALREKASSARAPCPLEGTCGCWGCYTATACVCTVATAAPWSALPPLQAHACTRAHCGTAGGHACFAASLTAAACALC